MKCISPRASVFCLNDQVESFSNVNIFSLQVPKGPTKIRHLIIFRKALKTGKCFFGKKVEQTCINKEGNKPHSESSGNEQTAEEKPNTLTKHKPLHQI